MLTQPKLYSNLTHLYPDHSNLTLTSNLTMYNPDIGPFLAGQVVGNSMGGDTSQGSTVAATTSVDHDSNHQDDPDQQSTLAAGGKKRKVQATKGQGLGPGAGAEAGGGAEAGVEGGAGAGVEGGDRHVTALTPLSPLGQGPHGVFPPLDHKQRVVRKPLLVLSYSFV